MIFLFILFFYITQQEMNKNQQQSFEQSYNLRIKFILYNNITQLFPNLYLSYFSIFISPNSQSLPLINNLMDSFCIPSKYDNKQSCPATLHNSVQVSFEQPLRKFSMVDLSHKINIDQVMVDIKLTPLKSNQFTEKIKLIYQSLNYIKNLSPNLLEQVRTAQLIIQNIQTKFHKQYTQTKRTTRQNSLNHSRNSLFHQNPSQSTSTHKKQQQSLMSKKKLNFINAISGEYDISPIKQLDQPTSRIVYTNFSIKEIQNSCKKELSHHKPSPIRNQSAQKIINIQSNKKLSLINQSQSNKNIRQQSGSKCKSVHKRTDSNFTVSNFDAQDQEMQRLTRNIKALDRVLEQKGLCIRNDNVKDQNRNKMPLKETNLNTYKQSMLKSQKKPLVFNSKQRMSSNNKQNW